MRTLERVSDTFLQVSYIWLWKNHVDKSGSTAYNCGSRTKQSGFCDPDVCCNLKIISQKILAKDVSYTNFTWKTPV